jgi:hypothetical protein
MEDLQNQKFTVNRANLYREEGISDLESAFIRRMVPINADGSPDKSRPVVYLAGAQVMTPDGPFPIQARLKARNLKEVFIEYPGAMKKVLDDLIAEGALENE